jgi:hypothetical protein
VIGSGSTVQDHERRSLAETLKVDLTVCCLYISIANPAFTPAALI